MPIAYNNNHELPDDIIKRITTFLSFQDVSFFAATNKKNHALVNEMHFTNYDPNQNWLLSFHQIKNDLDNNACKLKIIKHKIQDRSSQMHTENNCFEGAYHHRLYHFFADEKPLVTLPVIVILLLANFFLVTLTYANNDKPMSWFMPSFLFLIFTISANIVIKMLQSRADKLSLTARISRHYLESCEEIYKMRIEKRETMKNMHSMLPTLDSH